MFKLSEGLSDDGDDGDDVTAPGLQSWCYGISAAQAVMLKAF